MKTWQRESYSGPTTKKFQADQSTLHALRLSSASNVSGPSTEATIRV